MEFGILGPLVAADDAGTRVIAAAKQRTVLATLLLRAGQVVSGESMAETLWDGRPPPSAVASLRNYVMRLRRCLGPAGQRILSRGGGYLIDVAEEELDLLRFVRLHKEGASALGRGDLAEAAGTLTLALEQWRGPALSDVDADSVQRDECPRLEADRMDALELKLEAERGLGRYDTRLGELRRFALEYPERESLWEHLILALLHSGRRSEADATFQQIRRILMTEYGAAPGDRLQRLQSQIAAAPRESADVDPGSGASTRTRGSVTVRTTVPFQIPADLADFTGRAEETGAAVRLLAAPAPAAGRVLVLTGRPGIGKSALAVHVAHAVRESYPDGILYQRLESDSGRGLAPTRALAAFLEALGVAQHAVPGALDARSALFRSRLADLRVLLVLDAAVDSLQIRPLLPSTSQSTVLVTSRRRLDDLGGARHLELGPLSAGESIQLIGKIAGRARIAAEPQSVRELLLACGNLPLALRIAASRLAARPTWSVRSLTDRLADDGRRLDELATGALGVRECLAAGYRALPRTAADALPLLAGIEPPSVGLRDAAELLGMPQQQAEQVLECLVDHRFLTTTKAGRYGFPELVREFALELRPACHARQGQLPQSA